VCDSDPTLRPDIWLTVQQLIQHLKRKTIYLPPIEGILAAPPCTHFSNAGSRFWDRYDADGLTDISVSTVRACLALIEMLSPSWWALENPPGRITDILGPPAWSFQPYEYGDAYSKKTCIWGTARKPKPTNIVEPVKISPLLRLGGTSAKVKTLRSQTPQGFARAFAAENMRTRERGNHSQEEGSVHRGRREGHRPVR
jgi:hypothetical protein